MRMRSTAWMSCHRTTNISWSHSRVFKGRNFARSQRLSDPLYAPEIETCPVFSTRRSRSSMSRDKPWGQAYLPKHEAKVKLTHRGIQHGNIVSTALLRYLTTGTQIVEPARPWEYTIFQLCSWTVQRSAFGHLASVFFLLQFLNQASKSGHSFLDVIYFVNLVNLFEEFG